jgi:hypothetical protein
MRDWLSSLTVERIPELALGLAVGYALVTLADNIGQVAVSILAQHFGSDPTGQDSVLELLNLFSAPYYLSFTVGGTIVVYGNVIAALLSLGAVAAVGKVVVRRRDRVLGACPFCASRIPHESTHCAYCGSSVTLGET